MNTGIGLIAVKNDDSLTDKLPTAGYGAAIVSSRATYATVVFWGNGGAL